MPRNEPMSPLNEPRSRRDLRQLDFLWDRSRIRQRFRSFGEQRSGIVFRAHRWDRLALCVVREETIVREQRSGILFRAHRWDRLALCVVREETIVRE
jgi:hypothetical protein